MHTHHQKANKTNLIFKSDKTDFIKLSLQVKFTVLLCDLEKLMISTLWLKTMNRIIKTYEFHVYTWQNFICFRKLWM